MPYDSTPITSIIPADDDAELVVRWTSTAPSGTWYQVYVDRQLAGQTQSLELLLPYPGAGRYLIQVGAVAVADINSDLSASLPAISGTGDKVTLTWEGGTYLAADDDIKGFKIFSGVNPGDAVDYTHEIGDVIAYPQDVILDGWGCGGWGDGGWGEAASYYEWTSESLLRGTWNFGICPYDHAGNLGTPQTVAVAISTAPQPPAANSAGKRLTGSYSVSTNKVTLNWLASPG